MGEIQWAELQSIQHQLCTEEGVARGKTFKASWAVANSLSREGPAKNKAVNLDTTSEKPAYG